MRAGALIGSRGCNLESFLRFGFFLGAAFQIEDDLLNLVADEKYGKEKDGDLWEGKRTLILIYAYRSASADERERLAKILASPRAERSLEEVEWMRSLIDKYEGVEYGRRIAHQLAGAALHEFELLSAGLPDSRDKSFISQMPTWVIERNSSEQL